MYHVRNADVRTVRGQTRETRVADDVWFNAAHPRLLADGVHERHPLHSDGDDGSSFLTDSGGDVALSRLHCGPIKTRDGLRAHDYDSEHRLGGVEPASGLGERSQPRWRRSSYRLSTGHVDFLNVGLPWGHIRVSFEATGTWSPWPWPGDNHHQNGRVDSGVRSEADFGEMPATCARPRVAFLRAGFKGDVSYFCIAIGPSQTTSMVFVILMGMLGRVAILKWPQAIQRK